MRLTGGSTRTIATTTCGAVLLAAVAAGVLTRPEPSREGDPGTRTALQTLDLASAPVTRSSGASADATGSPAAALPQRLTRRFSMLGVTWTDPATRLDGTVGVRVRGVADGRWSDWLPLEVDEPSAADPGTEKGAVRGSTDPLWVGESDGVQARLLPASGQPARPLPAGLRVDLIDPGAEPAPQPAPAAYTAPITAATAAVPPRPAPRAVSRRGWNADESIVEDAPSYSSDVQVMFVHHTAGTNNYSCADSARIIRGIQAYHVRSKGWNDIGYNFLVDRCGTLFEGRAGGVTRAVLGAHTLGFNAHSAAIAVLGDYDGRGVPARVRTVIAQVAAYKVGMYGNNPAGRTTLASSGSDRYPAGTQVTMNRISAHRDTGRTECPGDALYGQLPAIRGAAGAPPAGLAITGLRGAVATGSIHYTRGTVTVGWNIGTSSSLMDRFDVLVDGARVASAPAGHRMAAVSLPPGRHEIRIRGVHLSGRVATTPARTVVVDRTAPAFYPGPAVALRTGSLNGSVPVTLSWRATDAGGLRSVALTRPSRFTFAPTTTRWSTTARPGTATTWGLRAVDRTGNATAAAVTRTPVVVSETAAARTGSWGLRRSTGFLSGTALYAAAAGASLTWTFTGRSASLAFTRSARSGRVQVYVDGTPAGTLDLHAAATAHRSAVWARTWPAGGQHTVRVVVQGTAGHPGVLSDGLVYLR
jgi:hypothetical protein